MIALIDGLMLQYDTITLLVALVQQHFNVSDGVTRAGRMRDAGVHVSHAFNTVVAPTKMYDSPAKLCVAGASTCSAELHACLN